MAIADVGNYNGDPVQRKQKVGTEKDMMDDGQMLYSGPSSRLETYDFRDSVALDDIRVNNLNVEKTVRLIMRAVFGDGEIISICNNTSVPDCSSRPDARNQRSVLAFASHVNSPYNSCPGSGVLFFWSVLFHVVQSCLTNTRQNSDPAVKQILLVMNEKQSFIIEDLDDHHLVIKADEEYRVRRELETEVRRRHYQLCSYQLTMILCCQLEKNTYSLD